jgi:hypothetical protein
VFKRETLTIIEVEGALCMWEHIFDNTETYTPHLEGIGYAALHVRSAPDPGPVAQSWAFQLTQAGRAMWMLSL